MGKRVVVIGIDGATLDLILPWVKEGKLPGFARLIDEGVYGPLESTPNQRSASAWVSMMTGKNPGKHGVFEFYEYVSGTYDIRFLKGNDRDSESLWGTLSRDGKKVVVINVPMTYPAEKVQGVMIAGLDSPGTDSKGFMHPPELQRVLSEKFGDYIIEPGITGFMVGGKIDEALDNLYRELDQKSRVTDYLMESQSWDFFMVVFRSLDAVQHCFWKYMDPGHPEHTEEGGRKYGNVIFEVYRKVDRYIEGLLRRMDDDTTVMVVSDHGFGRKHSATSQLNRWLESKGYLAFKNQEDRSSGWSRNVQTRILAGAYKSIVGKTPRKLKEKLVKLFPGLRDKVQSRLIFSDMDWRNTRVYTDTLFSNIMINLKGREPLGIVEPSEYRPLLEKLKKDLMECRDSETGEKIVDEVFERDEVYRGKHTEKAPDLLVRWREDISINGIKIEKAAGPAARPAGSYPLIPGEDPRIVSGDHRLHGIVFLKGPDIRQKKALQDANILDVTPTILYQLGCPISEDIDGKVLDEAFNKSCLDANPIRIEKDEDRNNGGPKDASVYSETDTKAIAGRLRDLGYIE